MKVTLTTVILFASADKFLKRKLFDYCVVTNDKIKLIVRRTINSALGLLTADTLASEFLFYDNSCLRFGLANRLYRYLW